MSDDIFKVALREIVAPILEHKSGSGTDGMIGTFRAVLEATQKHHVAVSLVQREYVGESR